MVIHDSMMTMESLAVVARATLALVFVSAGILKLASGSPVGDTMAAFGFRGPFWNAAGRWLPPLEIVVGLALVWPETTFAGALASVVLLGGFTMVMLAALRRGEAPPCNCFGAVTPQPISQRTIARNVLLLAFAIFAAVVSVGTPGPSLLAWAADSSIVAQSLVLVTLVLAIAVVAIGRTLHTALDTQRDLRASLAVVEHLVDEAYPKVVRAMPPVENGLPIGAPAPAFSLVNSEGSEVTLAGLLELDRPILFVSASSACGPCKALMPRLAEWARTNRARLTVLVAYAGDQPDKALMAGPMRVVTASEPVNNSYRLQWTPSAVLIDAEGRIASPVASGSEAIAAVVAVAERSERADVRTLGPHFLATTPGRAIGSRAPTLPGIEAPWPRLVVFWRLGCPHCRSMVTALQRWATERASVSDGAPDVVLVNWSGESSVGLDGFTVVHDEAGDLASGFGVSGTPSAVLVGTDGMVASAVAVGAPNVLALLGAEGR